MSHNVGEYIFGQIVSGESKFYLQRPADRQLLELCRSGTFSYILAPRQVGKSSLMLKTARLLVNEGIKSVIINLNQLGTQLDADTWYLGLLDIIEDQLNLDLNISEWWKANSSFNVFERLVLFFQKLLLTEMGERVVIFVDEIDGTLPIPFAGYFFDLIYYLHINRPAPLPINHLSFVLLGVATPAELVHHSLLEPFKSGSPVELTYFTHEECLPLAQGLNFSCDHDFQILEWTLKWTGGHPYLTQRLLYTISQQQNLFWSETEIDQLVKTTFFDDNGEWDQNLKYVRDFLTIRKPGDLQLLEVYRDIIQQPNFGHDSKDSEIVNQLKLSGIIRQRQQNLFVSNLIYQNVFSVSWIARELKFIEAQNQDKSY